MHMIHMYPCTMNTEISKQLINRMPCPPYSPNSSKPEVPGTLGDFSGCLTLEPTSEAGRNPLMYTDTCIYTQVAIIY